MPILPGSALKGLAAYYCDQVWRTTEEKFKKGGTYHRLLFGTTDDSGCITFHDAWYVPEASDATPLKLDVMTPHHPKWNDISEPVAPTDFDSPIPVPFLSVTGDVSRCRFVAWARTPDRRTGRNWRLICFAKRSRQGNWWQDKQRVWALRLREVGSHEERAGGTGGRVAEQEEQAKLAAMVPIERDVKEYPGSHPDKPPKTT